MELRVYSSQMELAGIADNMTSVIWTRRYNTPGEFQITAPITAENVSIFRRGRLVWKQGAADCGLIESIELEETQDSYQMTVKGRFLTCLLDRRVIGGAQKNPIGTLHYDGPSLQAFAWALEKCNTLVLPKDGISMSTDLPSGGESLAFEVTLRNLLSYFTKICRATGYGMRMRPDFAKKALRLEVWQGDDHSTGQAGKRVVFSREFDNLESANWVEDEIDHKNMAYLIHSGSGDSDVCELLNNDVSGLERREVRIDYSGSQDEAGGYSRYVQAANDFAREQLRTEYAVHASMESTTAPDVSFVYGVDYDLGDIVTVRADDWGVEENLRLTEISEVYENGTYTLSPVFGDPLPETLDWNDSD